MKKSTPSDEQIREFWEWCGFVICQRALWQQSSGVVCYEPNGWWYPDGRHEEILPPIDLNNLARYAIPKFMIEYHDWRSVLHDWVDGLTGDYDKICAGYSIVDALFWAIYSLITS